MDGMLIDAFAEKKSALPMPSSHEYVEASIRPGRAANNHNLRKPKWSDGSGAPPIQRRDSVARLYVAPDVPVRSSAVKDERCDIQDMTSASEGGESRTSVRLAEDCGSDA